MEQAFSALTTYRLRKDIEKYDAHAEPVIGGQLHRGHTYRVQFGRQPKYPVIEEIIEEIVL